MPLYNLQIIVIAAIFGFATAQLEDGLGFGQVGEDVGVGFSGLSDGQDHVLQQQYNFPAVTSSSISFGGFDENVGVGSGLLGGGIGIPSQESITQLGQAIAEGGIPSGTNGEISTPTEQPPLQGVARRVGIAQRLLGAGFLNRRRK